MVSTGNPLLSGAAAVVGIKRVQHEEAGTCCAGFTRRQHALKSGVLVSPRADSTNISKARWRSADRSIASTFDGEPAPVPAVKGREEEPSVYSTGRQTEFKVRDPSLALRRTELPVYTASQG